MRLQAARLTVELEPRDATGPLRGLGIEGPEHHLAGYLAAETLMFRAVNAGMGDYLHLQHRTWVRSSFPSTGVLVADVTVDQAQTGDFRVNANIDRGGSEIMQSSALLRPGTISSTKRESSDKRMTPPEGAPVARNWMPDSQASYDYAGWCHPNLHTDEEMARRFGLRAPVVQGLMVQNMGLLVAAKSLGFNYPFAVESTFRRPMTVGETLSFCMTCSGQAANIRVIDSSDQLASTVKAAFGVSAPGLVTLE